MNHEANDVRQYQSEVRADKARATRASIVTAALDLFSTRGYGKISVDDVARSAGVSRATVFNSVGGKPALMQAAYHAAVVGSHDPRPAREGPMGERARAATTAGEVLEVYVDVLAEVFAKVAPLHQALVHAASDSDELEAMLAALDQERHAGAAAIVAMAAERGPLSTELSRERAADVLWALSNPGLWQHLHGERSWSREDFRSWLLRLMKTQLLPPGS